MQVVDPGQLVVILLFGVLTISLLRSMYDVLVSSTGQRASHVPSGMRDLEKQYFGDLAANRASREEMERALAAKEKSSDPDESALLTEEQEIETTEEYADILIAAEKDFSARLNQAIATETDAITREQQMIAAVTSYGSAIDQQLGRMNSLAAVDDAGRQYLVTAVTAIAQVCRQIVAFEQDKNRVRQNFILDLARDMDAIDRSIKNAKKLETNATRIDKKLENSLGRQIIAQVELKLATKKESLKQLLQRIKSAKRSQSNAVLADQLEVQLAAIQAEVSTIKTELQSMKVMKQQLSKLLGAVKQSLASVVSMTKAVIAAEDGLKSQRKKQMEALATFAQDQERLTIAFAQFTSFSKSLATDAASENIVVDATVGVGGIFTAILASTTRAKEYHTTTSSIFAEEMIHIYQETQQLSSVLQGLHSGFVQTNNAYVTLKAAGKQLLGDVVSKEDQQIIGAAASIEQLALKQGQQRSRLIQETFQALEGSGQKVQNLIADLGRSLEQTSRSEQTLLQQLSRALDIIVKNKSRVHQEFTTQGQQFTAKVAQAQEQVIAQRAR